MAYDRRSFAGGGIATTITTGINGSTLTIPIAASTGWPTGSAGDFYVVLERGTASEEKVRIDVRSSLTLTAITGGRGVDGTTAVSHASGAAIELCLTAVDLDEANAHISDTGLDHHTQYLNNARHDVAARHTFGSALGTPAAAADIATAAAAGTGTVPARSDHVHKIGAGAINSAGMFAAGVVDAAAIATDAVGSAEIAAGAVAAAELASDAVTTAKILDANVTTAKIADSAVTAVKVATALGRQHIVANAAALAALTGLREGDTAYQADIDRLKSYDGTAWRIPYPLGYVADSSSSGASVALDDTSTRRSCPGTSVVISNTDGVTRRYKIFVEARFSMASGTNGLYRAVVTNGSTTELGGGVPQAFTTVTGGPGQVGCSTSWTTTVTAAGSLTVAAGGLRVSGGGTSDTIAQGRCFVEDLGPA